VNIFAKRSAAVAIGLALCLPAIGVKGALAQSAAPATTAPQRWTTIPIPPLRDFKPVQPKRIELANGLVIFLQEDHELPFISGTILIRGGSRDEPAEKIGLVSLYGQTWRTSGTAKVNGDLMDDQLENKAAILETGGGGSSTSVNWNSLKGDFDSVFETTMDLLLHPVFSEEKLMLAKQQMITGIARRNDDASSIAARETAIVVYGATSPFARQPEYATVDAVKLDDMKAWHDRTVIPNGMIVAVSGDFDSATMEATLRKAFEPLKKGTLIQSAKQEFPGPKPGIYFANKSDVNQSNVYIVGLGTVRSNPDYYALQVMNEIFSGGFGSRIVQNVRTKLGLAYSVGGSFGAQYDHPGVFRVGAGTKSTTTVPAGQAMMAEIGRLKTDPPTEDELRKAKDQVLNSFIFNFDSRDKVLNEQVTLAFYGYPPDFLDKYKAAVEKVTTADVSRVANKYIDTSKLAFVVVGNDAKIDPALSTMGKVTTLDITIPPPPPDMMKMMQQ
jgi:zinc protease